MLHHFPAFFAYLSYSCLRLFHRTYHHWVHQYQFNHHIAQVQSHQSAQLILHQQVSMFQFHSNENHLTYAQLQPHHSLLRAIYFCSTKLAADVSLPRDCKHILVQIHSHIACFLSELYPLYQVDLRWAQQHRRPYRLRQQ